MTSAAFAMPDDSRQRVSIRRRTTTNSTSTSAAADAALQYALDRRLRKQEGRLPPPRRQTPLGGGPAAVAASVDRLGWPQWLLRAGVLGFVAVVLGGAVLSVSGGTTSHTVAGRVLLGKAPLKNATITFHRASGNDGQQAVSLTTGADGSFQIAEDQPLPAGLYAIVVDAGRAGKATVVPPLYRDPGTTPLRVLVTENLSGLQLLVRR